MCEARILAELKRTNVGGDRPTISWFHLLGVRKHNSVTFTHHVVDVPHGRLSQAFYVIRGWCGKSTLHDHPIAFASATVAGCTVNIETFSATLEDLCTNRNWKSSCQIRPYL